MKHKGTLLIPLLLVLMSLGAAEPRGWLGIYHKELDGATMAALGVEHGVILTDVTEKSPAATAGFKIGDVIVKIDTEEVISTDDLVRLIGDKPEKTVRIEYLRLGKIETTEVKLGTRERQLELNIPDLPELKRMTITDRPEIKIMADGYMKDLQELREEIVILRREIERLRKDLKKMEK